LNQATVEILISQLHRQFINQIEQRAEFLRIFTCCLTQSSNPLCTYMHESRPMCKLVMFQVYVCVCVYISCVHVCIYM